MLAGATEPLHETGMRGEGGDLTLVIDQQAERLVLDELEQLHRRGARFQLVSEECGTIDFGGGPLRVVVDPIDGSMNAKRGLPACALSIAIADGPTMDDAWVGYVRDFGTGEEWHALRGEGAWLDGAPLEPVAERRTADGLLELVAIEIAHPARLAAAVPALRDVAHRVRSSGSIALALCQVAGARVDAMAALGPCRSVDSAAAQLIVRESGGLVGFPGASDGVPVDALTPVAPVAAARTAAGLALAERIASAS